MPDFSYTRTLDKEGRFFLPGDLPGEWRSLGARFIIAADQNYQCLRLIRRADQDDEVINGGLRAPLKNIKLGSQSRLTLTERQRSYIKEDGEVKVIFCDDYIEIWAQAVWDKQDIDAPFAKTMNNMPPPFDV